MSRLILSAIVLGGWSIAGYAKEPSRLHALTAPDNRLPPDCSLKEGGSGSSGPLRLSEATANPWIGTNARNLAAIRGFVNGVPAAPDGPPLSRGEATRFFLRLAEGVEEGYAAIYAQPDGGDVAVYAVRFADSKSAVAVQPRAPRSTRRLTSRFVLGSIVAVVHADTGAQPCFEAIREYVHSLEK